jgi:hypothetical protein
MEYNIEKLSDGKRVVTIDGKKCELVGNGFIRQDYPPYVRQLLKKHGDKRIIAMKACRTPITISTDLLNIVSLGQFKKNLESKPFDDLFHLDLRIELEATPRMVTPDTSKMGKEFNKKVSERRMTMLLEKKHVIKASMNPTEKPNTQFSYIPIHSNELTINKLLEGAKRILGNKFFTYDAYNNNCQDFIMAILNGSRIGTEENRKFIKQDTKDLFDELPVTKKIARLATDTGATLDRIVYGQGNWSSGEVEYRDEIDRELNIRPELYEQELNDREWGQAEYDFELIKRIIRDNRIFKVADKPSNPLYSKANSIKTMYDKLTQTGDNDPIGTKVMPILISEINYLLSDYLTQPVNPSNADARIVEPQIIQAEAEALNDEELVEGVGIHKSDNYYIQSVVFDKEKFDVKGARKWLKENNYIARKPDVTETQIRFRQVNPKYIEQKGFTKFRTKRIGRKSGISLIISYKK